MGPLKSDKQFGGAIHNPGGAGEGYEKMPDAQEKKKNIG